MQVTLSRIVTYVLIFLVQIVLNDFLNISPYLFLCLIPLSIIIIPRGVPAWKIMIFGFFFGLLFDIISDGVIGLNAAASVVLAATRDLIYNLLAGKENNDKFQVISPANGAFRQYLKAVTSCIAIYLLVYFLFDSIKIFSSWFFLAKFSISLIANTILTLAISHLILKN